MNESTWKFRIDALKATEKSLAERERKCRIRELAMQRAIEEGVNSRQERQLFDLVEQCIHEHDSEMNQKLEDQYFAHHRKSSNNNSTSNNRISSSSIHHSPSTVTALDEIANIAVELDSMRRNVLIEAEDISLERHRLRIWAEQLHAAFASLNARSVELQLEAKRLSGLPQATIEFSSTLAASIMGLNNNNNNNNTDVNSSMYSNNNNTNDDYRNNNNASSSKPTTNSSGQHQPLHHEVLLRREAAMNEREKHVTDLFRYVLDQRSLVERQLELIGQRIEALSSSSSLSSPSLSQQRQQQREDLDSTMAPRDGRSASSFSHPLLSGSGPNPEHNNTSNSITNTMLNDLDYAEQLADSKTY